MALSIVEPEARRRTIVVILCDDLGYGDLGCYGTEVIAAPNVERLAGEGVQFTSFYASHSVGMPSRAGYLI